MSKTQRRRTRAVRPSSLLVALSLLAAVFTAPFATGQNNTTEPAARFMNLTPFARHEWGTATIPFRQGEFLPGETWRAVGVPSEVTPFGARWPDGSVRFAKLDALLSMQPGEELVVDVRQDDAPTPNVFTFGPWTRANLQHFTMEFLVNTATGQHTAPLVPREIVEFTGSRLTVHFQSRFPQTDLIYDLWITWFAGQEHARFELRVTNSSTMSPLWFQDFDSLGFRVRGAAPMIRHSLYHRIQQSAPTGHGWNTVVLIASPDFFYDGQAMEWYGDMLFQNPAFPHADAEDRVLTFLAAATMQELQGVATNWPASGTFGPLGKVPPTPPWWTDDGRWNQEIERDEFLTFVGQPGDRWGDRLMGLLPNAAGVGDQYDFGATTLGDIVRSTYPHRLEEIRFGIGEEAMRPVHHREPNGSIVSRSTRPDWISYSGRTHWSNAVSPDRLNKPYPEPWLSQNAHGWNGKDNEHWSSLGLAVTYLLTGSHSLRHEIDNDIELYLSSHTLPSMVALQTNSIGPARALGRTMLSMSWHYLCTGREDVKTRLFLRAQECVAVQYDGINFSGQVKPTKVYPTDARAGVVGDFWMPWQEGIAVIGLHANHRVTGSPEALTFARMCALSVVQNAFNMDPDPLLFRLGYAMAFQPDGAALTPTQLTDPNFVQWASSISFGYWCVPAIKTVRQMAIDTGDTALLNHTNTVLSLVDAQRRPQRTGRWDRYADWDGID